MRLTFFSNYLNHHQLPFCLEMQKLLGDDFRFVATTPFNESRLQNGYVDMNKEYAFVLCSYESKAQFNRALQLAVDSDVIISGSAPETFLRQRLIRNPKGLTFRYAERLYKETAGRIDYKDPMFYWNYLYNTLFGRRNFCLLAASAYAPYDFVRTGFHKDQIYKWGYFPDTSPLTLEQLLAKKGEQIQLIWVGRMIGWKHPEQAVEAARVLQGEKLSFRLKMIGEGPLRGKIEQKIKQYGLENVVVLTGGLPTETVRDEMERSHIHLFTSDYNEGWGAVLNESMASACAPVCSGAVGAAPFLIEQGITGFQYDHDSINALCEAVRRLMRDRDLLARVQVGAYQKIKNEWNPKVAASHFIRLCESMLNKEDMEPEHGPCSRAAIQPGENG